MLEAVFIAVTMAPATQRVERPQTSHPPHHPVPLERLYNVRQPRAVETPQRGVSAAGYDAARAPLPRGKSSFAGCFAGVRWWPWMKPAPIGPARCPANRGPLTLQMQR